MSYTAFILHFSLYILIYIWMFYRDNIFLCILITIVFRKFYIYFLLIYLMFIGNENIGFWIYFLFFSLLWFKPVIYLWFKSAFTCDLSLIFICYLHLLLICCHFIPYFIILKIFRKRELYFRNKTTKPFLPNNIAVYNGLNTLL